MHQFNHWMMPHSSGSNHLVDGSGSCSVILDVNEMEVGYSVTESKFNHLLLYSMYSCGECFNPSILVPAARAHLESSPASPGFSGLGRKAHRATYLLLDWHGKPFPSWSSNVCVTSSRETSYGLHWRLLSGKNVIRREANSSWINSFSYELNCKDCTAFR